MRNPIRDYLNRQPFRIADRLFPRRAVCHNPRQLQRLRDPTSVVLAIKLD
jgi:hypothetical protein